VNDLERLYRQLVATLSANGPARWQDPMRLSELMNVLPYRAARRILNIDSSEEFELLMLRLAGGEGGYMSTEPEAVGQRFALEAVSTNPELGVLREFRDAHLMFAPAPLMKVLAGSTGDESYAPPQPVAAAPAPAAPPPPTPTFAPARITPAPARSAPVQRTAAAAPAVRKAVSAPAVSSPVPASVPDAGHCTACDRALPTARAVNFCPHCGQGQATGHCVKCGAEADLSWHFCVTCGVGLPWSTYR
jgi:predicted RNA-binding Zn-ribbon protein involved in translation (DUF1610 family)